MTAIFVTHDQTEANALADRIAVMEGGVLQQFASQNELKDSPANLFVGDLHRRAADECASMPRWRAPTAASASPSTADAGLRYSPAGPSPLRARSGLQDAPAWCGSASGRTTSAIGTAMSGDASSPINGSATRPTSLPMWRKPAGCRWHASGSRRRPRTTSFAFALGATYICISSTPDGAGYPPRAGRMTMPARKSATSSSASTPAPR